MAKVLARTIEGQPRAYRGFVISPSVVSTPSGWFWFVLGIYRHSDDRTSSHHYPKSNATFPTIEEAEAAAIRLGQQIIDGEIPAHIA